MTKQKKLMITIISCILAVALITTAIILIVANANREKTQTSILTCEVNPKIHFVLNGNDKVMEVVALNNDGEIIANNGNFVGLKADAAVQLFVKLSTQGGYIDVNTEGTRVDVTITGLKNNYDKMKDKVVSSINGYFDENGIVAGAVATIEEDIKKIITDLNPSAKDMENKSNEELINQYVIYVDRVEGLRAGEIAEFYNSYITKVTEFEEAKAEIQQAIDALKAKITATTDETQLAIFESNMKGLERALTELENTLLNKIEMLKENIKVTEDYIATLQTNFTKKVTELEKTIADHKAAFNQNKATIEQKIAEYRNSLEA